MRVTITIDCDNAAFNQDNGGPEAEVARILKWYAKLLNDGLTNMKLSPRGRSRAKIAGLRDSNGNTVGEVELCR